MRGLAFPLLNSETAAIALSDIPPDPEALTPAAGQMPLASRGDHVHPRLTSSQASLVLGSNGSLAVTFSRTFATKPAIVLTPVQSAVSTTPVMLEIQSFTQTGGVYTGCVVRGYRGQSLPAVIALLGTLVNFNVFGASAAGVEFTLIAVQSS